MSETNNLPRIKRLSSSLANQIAAGEVIERPASVIKELLENSLDAGASRIVIDVSKAGSQLIRVTDNGCGIHPQDLELALERHATAKLDNDSDLAAIKSLGFRGEALPSISSVADITLTSRIEVIEQAASLSFAPATGESSFKPAAHPVGTTVEVRNLFHTTPARKKFLRSERTEFLHIQEMIRKIALSCADVSIDFRHNDQKVLSCRAHSADLSGRVASLLGPSFTEKAIYLDYSAGDMHIYGWLGVGDLARSSTDRQYLYLNGRMIRDKRLNHAIRLACEGRLAEGRFPSYVVYLNLDLAAADVNVHPTKHEVRFRHARDVHDFLFAALSASMEKDQDFYPLANSDNQQNEHYSSAIDAEPGSLRRHNVAGEVRSTYGDMNAIRQTELIRDLPGLGKPLLHIQGNCLLT
jgi:DNA mismatch repair protein MutL